MYKNKRNHDCAMRTKNNKTYSMCVLFTRCA